jgi:hypothetical protein
MRIGKSRVVQRKAETGARGILRGEREVVKTNFSMGAMNYSQQGLLTFPPGLLLVL